MTANPMKFLKIFCPWCKCIPGCENASLNEVDYWLSGDNQYEITDKETNALVKSDDAEDEDCESIQPQKITNNKGVIALEAANQYNKQTAGDQGC